MRTYLVYQGALDPAALQVDIEPSDAVPDLSLVTSVEIVSKDTRTRVVSTWSTTIASQSETALQVVHRYDTADTATVRTLHQYAVLTITGAANPVATTPWDLRVVTR